METVISLEDDFALLARKLEMYHVYPKLPKDKVSPCGTSSDSNKLPSQKLVLTLSDILLNPPLAKYFQTYLVQTHAEENLIFLQQIAELRAAHATNNAAAWDVRTAHSDTLALVGMFFASSSALELNIPGNMRLRILRAFRARLRTLQLLENTLQNIPSIDDLNDELDKLSIYSSDTYCKSQTAALCAGTTPPSEELVSSPEKYFSMFDEVQAHVTELLRLPARGFIQQLRKSNDILLKTPQRLQKRVVIIGGGFCGSLCARFLDRHSNLHVCLIDSKPYFEFTAAIIRLIPDPQADTIALPHSSYIKHGQFVLGFVDSVCSDHVVLQASGENIGGMTAATRKIPFDYCVLATGSSYGSTIKSANTSSAYRARKLVYEHSRLVKARAVAIIGGGYIGVELAAEIASAFGTSKYTPPYKNAEYSPKRVILIDANNQLLKKLPAKAAERALLYLRDVLGIEIFLNERIAHHDTRSGFLISASGRTFRIDMVYLATGPVPQVGCMEAYFGHLLTSDPPRKEVNSADPSSHILVQGNSPSPPAARRIRVTATHQLEKAPHIFVGGDCAATPVPEEKMALTAQCAAVAIARNIVRLESGKTPIERGTKGLRSFMTNPPVQFISLGRFSALALINNVVFIGPKYLRIKWDELKTKYFDFLVSDADTIPTTLRLLWGQAPRPLHRMPTRPEFRISASSNIETKSTNSFDTFTNDPPKCNPVECPARRQSESSNSSSVSIHQPFCPSAPSCVQFEYVPPSKYPLNTKTKLGLLSTSRPRDSKPANGMSKSSVPDELEEILNELEHESHSTTNKS